MAQRLALVDAAGAVQGLAALARQTALLYAPLLVLWLVVGLRARLGPRRLKSPSPTTPPVFINRICAERIGGNRREPPASTTCGDGTEVAGGLLL